MECLKVAPYLTGALGLATESFQWPIGSGRPGKAPHEIASRWSISRMQQAARIGAVPQWPRRVIDFVRRWVDSTAGRDGIEGSEFAPNGPGPSFLWSPRRFRHDSCRNFEIPNHCCALSRSFDEGSTPGGQVPTKPQIRLSLAHVHLPLCGFCIDSSPVPRQIAPHDRRPLTQGCYSHRPGRGTRGTDRQGCWARKEANG